jgi:hypothetical protein
MSIGSNPNMRKILLAAERRLAPILPRHALLAAGRKMTSGQLCRLRTILGTLEQGHWLNSVAAPVPNLPDRFGVFGEAVRRVQGQRPLYLEFGVFQGRTLRWWAQHLEGLPEDWRADSPKGWFNAGGLPRFDDARVSLVPGWFDQTLPCWEPPDHDQLIVNVDCDLYSSTVSVLKWLEPYLQPGTLVYFDDLLDRDDELRAVQEWAGWHGSDVVPLAMARWGQHMLFEFRGARPVPRWSSARAPQSANALVAEPPRPDPAPASAAAASDAADPAGERLVAPR